MWVNRNLRVLRPPFKGRQQQTDVCGLTTNPKTLTNQRTITVDTQSLISAQSDNSNHITSRTVVPLP